MTFGTAINLVHQGHQIYESNAIAAVTSHIYSRLKSENTTLEGVALGLLNFPLSHGTA